MYVIFCSSYSFASSSAFSGYTALNVQSRNRCAFGVLHARSRCCCWVVVFLTIPISGNMNVRDAFDLLCSPNGERLRILVDSRFRGSNNHPILKFWRRDRLRADFFSVHSVVANIPPTKQPASYRDGGAGVWPLGLKNLKMKSILQIAPKCSRV